MPKPTTRLPINSWAPLSPTNSHKDTSMKLLISYTDRNDNTHEFLSTKEFDGPGNEGEQHIIDRIQDLANQLEDINDICIDHGGDNDTYELNVADYPTNVDMDLVCKHILQVIENKLPKELTDDIN